MFVINLGDPAVAQRNALYNNVIKNHFEE